MITFKEFLNESKDLPWSNESGLVSSEHVFGNKGDDGLSPSTKLFNTPFSAKVKHHQLIPSQPEIHAPSVREKAKNPQSKEVEVLSRPGLGKVRYEILDGHHEAAASLLRGDKTVKVKVIGVKK